MYIFHFIFVQCFIHFKWLILSGNDAVCGSGVCVWGGREGGGRMVKGVYGRVERSNGQRSLRRPTNRRFVWKTGRGLKGNL